LSECDIEPSECDSGIRVWFRPDLTLTECDIGPSECDSGIRVWFRPDHTLTECDIGSSEWDLARSHSDERLECDSAYFDQWRFKLRVVLSFIQLHVLS